MWSVQGPNLYVMARLAAHPDLSVDKMLDEYYSAFGKGKPYIKKYFEYWKDYLAKNTDRINKIYESSRWKWYFHGLYYAEYVNKIFPPETFPPAFKLLKKGLAATESTSKEHARVKFLYDGLEHALICVKTAQVYADKNKSSQDRESIKKQLEYCRKKLNPLAVNQKYSRQLENRSWKLAGYLHRLDLKTAIKMPEMWKVKTDRKKTGEKGKWFAADLNDEKWKKASSWKALEEQGYKDYRYMWYRINIAIPENKKGKKVILFLGAVDDSCWLWVNGKPAGKFIYNAEVDPGSWEKPLEFDVSKFVEFGKDNQFTVLLRNICGQGGIWKPSYIDFRH
jgi:hypothetical protein